MTTNDFSDTRPVGLYDDALGSKRRDYYLDKFEDFDQKGEGWHPSWNWAAFFFTGFWALYRKMYGWAFAWLVAFTIFGVLGRNPSNKASFWLLVWNLAVVVSFATFSNAIYHRKIKARIAAARLSNPGPSRVSRRLIAGGGVHAWVLIVLGAIPVMGIVAAVVLPAYQDYTKPKVAAENPFSNPDFGKPVAVNPFEATQKIAATDHDEKSTWSGNPFDKFDSVADIERRARQFPQLNEQRAWAAVVAWQANQMEDGKTEANHALYDAVGTVLDGLNQNRGICRPGRTVFVDAASASADFPVGTPMTLWACDR